MRWGSWERRVMMCEVRVKREESDNVCGRGQGRGE